MKVKLDNWIEAPQWTIRLDPNNKMYHRGIGYHEYFFLNKKGKFKPLHRDNSNSYREAVGRLKKYYNVIESSKNRYGDYHFTVERKTNVPEDRLTYKTYTLLRRLYGKGKRMARITAINLAQPNRNEEGIRAWLCH